MALLIIDGNNVYGSRPDGWWRDRRSAARRLAEAVDEWQRGGADAVVLVFDGRPDRSLLDRVREGFEVVFAPGPGRDAADDRIVALVEDRYAEAEPGSITVVTSDRGLVERLPPGVVVERSRAFARRLGDR